MGAENNQNLITRARCSGERVLCRVPMIHAAVPCIEDCVVAGCSTSVLAQQQQPIVLGLDARVPRIRYCHVR